MGFVHPEHILSLKPVFERFKLAHFDRVQGVIKIDSHVPGPAVGITACTHGNEPAGLAVFQHLLEEVRVHENLLSGSLYLVLNNIEAAQAYFDATSEEEAANARYCDVNMNRLPDDTLQFPETKLYETRRACELNSVWRRFSAGLDIHSTTDASQPMIISRGDDFPKHLARGFPITVLISNIDRVQWHLPAFSFYGSGKSLGVLAIEAGQHSDPQSLTIAIDCCTSFLQNLKMLEGSPERESTSLEEYCVRDKITFGDRTWEFVRHFEMFELLKHNELIARNESGRELRAPAACHLLFPTRKPKGKHDLSEEAGFLSEPVRTLELT